MSLSDDGRIVAIGAYGNDDNGSCSGHVRDYTYSGHPITPGQWTQVGEDIDGERAGDGSGGRYVSLSDDGRTVAIGATSNDGNGSDSGHVRVYTYNHLSSPVTAQWTQVGEDIDRESAYDYSGRSVSLSNDGRTVAIGAPYNDGNGSYSGHGRVFNIG